MRGILLLSAFAPWVGCLSEGQVHEGTSVGNPGSAKLQVAPVKDLEVSDADFPLDRVEITACTGRVTVIDAGDLGLGGAVEVGEGRWCRIAFVFDGPLVLSGDGRSGGAFELVLDVPAIRLSTDTAVRGGSQAWILEVGEPEWLSTIAERLSEAGMVRIAPGDDGHDVLVDLVVQRSALYADRDRDGLLSDRERSAGPVATASGGR